MLDYWSCVKMLKDDQSKMLQGEVSVAILPIALSCGIQFWCCFRSYFPSCFCWLGPSTTQNTNAWNYLSCEFFLFNKSYLLSICPIWAASFLFIMKIIYFQFVLWIAFALVPHFEPAPCHMVYSKYGCCWDNRSIPNGPNGEGCPGMYSRSAWSQLFYKKLP